MGSDKIEMSERQLRSLVKEAVHETLTTMGVDATQPIEMQKDFQHLREWRVTTEGVKKKGILTVTGIVVAGFCAAVWLYITTGGGTH